MRFVGTKDQIADIFTKGSFSAATWKNLCNLAQIGPPLNPVSPPPEKGIVGEETPRTPKKGGEVPQGPTKAELRSTKKQRRQQWQAEANKAISTMNDDLRIYLGSLENPVVSFAQLATPDNQRLAPLELALLDNQGRKPLRSMYHDGRRGPGRGQQTPIFRDDSLRYASHAIPKAPPPPQPNDPKILRTEDQQKKNAKYIMRECLKMMTFLARVDGYELGRGALA